MAADSIADDLDMLARVLADEDGRRAYSIGEAAARGWADLPIPHDSVYETLIDGVPARVMMVEPPHD